MQTVISNELAFGVPGTHANGQPFYADSYVTPTGDTDSAITFGTLVALVSGKIVPATGTAALGLAVAPNEHVRWVLPDGARSLVADKGSTIAVAKRGAWYVAVPTADKANWVAGAKLAIASGAFVVSGTGTAGEVIEVSDDKTAAIVRLYL